MNYSEVFDHKSDVCTCTCKVIMCRHAHTRKLITVVHVYSTVHIIAVELLASALWVLNHVLLVAPCSLLHLSVD